MPVPAAKFEEAFGLSWKDALAAGSVYNALDAVSYSSEINFFDEMSRAAHKNATPNGMIVFFTEFIALLN